MTDKVTQDSDKSSPGPMGAAQYKSLASKMAGKEKTLDQLAEDKDFDPSVT